MPAIQTKKAVMVALRSKKDRKGQILLNHR